VKTRQANLQHSHQALVNNQSDESARYARYYAAYAEFADQTVKALRVLKADPGKFERDYLQ